MLQKNVECEMNGESNKCESARKVTEDIMQTRMRKLGLFGNILEWTTDQKRDDRHDGGAGRKGRPCRERIEDM